MHLLNCPQHYDQIKSLIGAIDYSSALFPNVTEEYVEKTCKDAIKYGFAAVAVFPNCIAQVANLLKGSNVNTQIAVGFPCGNNMPEIKYMEAELGLKSGAKEVDMVMNLHKFAQGKYGDVKDEVARIVELAAKYNVGVKMIMETGFLTDEQKLIACDIAIDAGAEFVKTCTGFGPGRATLHDIAMISNHVGDKIKIKASGGVASLEDALGFINAGAARSAGRYNMIEQLEKIGYQP